MTTQRSDPIQRRILDLRSPLLSTGNAEDVTGLLAAVATRRASKASTTVQPLAVVGGWLASLREFAAPPSPLVNAAAVGDVEQVQALVDARVDPSEGAPSAAALRHGRWSVLELLVEHGVRLPEESVLCPRDHLLNFVSSGKFACDGCGHRVTSVFCCRRCNYDLCTRCAKQEDVALASLVRCVCDRTGDRGLVELILRARAQVNSRDASEATPLLWAANRGSLHVLQTLLRSDANVHAKDARGVGAMATAAFRGDLLICRELLQAACSANAKDRVEQTPLHFACLEGHLSVAELLLFSRAIPGQRSVLGRDALSCAVEGNHRPLIHSLVSAKASVNASSKNGESALHTACSRGYPAVVRVLLELRADPGLRTTVGALPYDLAVNNTGVQELLREAIGERQEPEQPREKASDSSSQPPLLTLDIVSLAGELRARLMALPKARVATLLAEIPTPEGSMVRLVFNGRILHAHESLDDCGVRDDCILSCVVAPDLSSTGLCGRWERRESTCAAFGYHEKSETYLLTATCYLKYVASESYDDGEDPTCTTCSGEGTWAVEDNNNLLLSFTVQKTDSTSFCAVTCNEKNNLRMSRTWFEQRFKRTGSV